MNKKSYIIILAVSLLFAVAGSARAISVNQDVTVQINGQNVTMTSGSSFATLTVNSNGGLSIQVDGGQSVTLQKSGKSTFSNDQGVETSCSGGSSSISLAGGKTYALSIGGSCGGSSGGGDVATTPSGSTPAPTPTPASTSSSSTGDSSSTGGSTVSTSSSTPAPTPQTDVTPPVSTTSGPTSPTSPTSPTPSTSVSLPTTELQMGMENTEVVKLQALLATDSEVYPDGKVTGLFGPMTKRAVQKFQKKYGLPQVGRVGPQTLAKLAEVFGGSVAQEPPIPLPVPSGGKLTRKLQIGDEGDDVSRLQAFLAGDSEIYPEGQITGRFGRLTKAAVKRFQAKYGIPQVGRVGPATLAKLNELMQ